MNTKKGAENYWEGAVMKGKRDGQRRGRKGEKKGERREEKHHRDRIGLKC